MPKQIYQTEIHIYHGKNGSDVTISHRHNETHEYKEKVYKPTKDSWKRVNNTVSNWINKNQASISLVNNSIFVELL